MNVTELVQKGKLWREGLRARARARFTTVPRDVLVVGIIALSSSASFGLGMLVERDLGKGSPFTVTEAPLVESSVATVAVGAPIAPLALPATDTQVIASKNGTKYYYSWCSGISRISPENRVTFATPAVAEAKGYTLSSTCKGK